MGDVTLQIQVTADIDISSTPKRQCWACVKKRLVCDFTRPACKKCRTAGIDCPGYSQKKPLRWLETGKVTSRKTPTRQGPSVISRKGKKNTSASSTCVAAAKKAPVVPIATDGDWRAMARLLAEANDYGCRTTVGVEIGAVGSKKKGIRDGKMDVLFEAGRYAVSAEDLYCSDVDLLPRNYLRDETAEIIQAIHFYNERSYPMMLEYHQMAPSPLILSFTPTALHHLPAAINHAMVAFALGYRMHRQELPSKEVWSKVYHHRGLAIRDISQRIQSCTSNKITSQRQESVVDITIASIFVFLCSELQQCASPNWRYHTDAMARLIKLRGGLKELWQKSLPLRSSLIHFIIIATFANATSPASDHISIAPHSELLEMLNEMYDEVFSYCLCPSLLFKEIVSINFLRSQAAKGTIDVINGQTVASEIFRRIESFSPSDWASKIEGFATEINLIGSIYHSAAMLYCIISLEHLHLLDPSILTQPIRHKYTVRLTAAIRAGLEWPRVKYFITWPIVVLGVEVAGHGPEMQDWVEGLLVGMSKEFGNCSPLVARSALRKFWKEKRKLWDECFDKPYAFCC